MRKLVGNVFLIIGILGVLALCLALLDVDALGCAIYCPKHQLFFPDQPIAEVARVCWCGR